MYPGRISRTHNIPRGGNQKGGGLVFFTKKIDPPPGGRSEEAWFQAERVMGGAIRYPGGGTEGSTVDYRTENTQVRYMRECEKTVSSTS